MTVSASFPAPEPSHLRVLHLPKTFTSKAYLPLQPETLWRIEVGVVRTFTWTEEGRTITLGFWGPGDVVGWPLTRMNPYQVECLTDVQARQISSEDVTLNQALLVHVWRNEELLRILHEFSALDRLQQLLNWLAEQFGQPIPQGKLLNLNLTQEGIADTLSMTRVTVTRLLCQLEREGKIQRYATAPFPASCCQFGKLSRQSLIVKSLIVNTP
jgi:CRP-like cAMP-binding protein